MNDQKRINETLISRTVRFAFIQQTVVVVIASLVLDGGDTFRLSLVAALLSLATIVVICFQRMRSDHTALSQFDIISMKYSFWLFFIIMLILYHNHVLPDRFYHFSN